MKRLQPGLIFVGFWALLVLGGRSNFFRDPGTFWHTVVGEKILTEGFVDRDPFTFTFRGDLWVPYQWLGEVVMALAHRLNGLDATRRIRESDWGRTTHIVALTGWGQDQDRRKSAEAGADGHLVKPVAPETVFDLLAGLADVR